jgi:hypothetical protein
MLKRITFIIVVGLASLTASAQFKMEHDTLYAYGYAGTDIQNEVGTDNHIISTATSGSEIINWRRTVNQLPDPKWSSAICDILYCRGPEVDTGSFLFDAGDTGYLSFHFYTKDVSGKGKMVVRFSRASNPLDYVDVVVLGTAWKPVGIKDINTSVTSIMPNPAKNEVTLTNNRINNGKLEVYNAMGQIVLTTDYLDQMTLDIKHLANGVYTIKISNASYSSVSKIVKE